MLTRQKSMPLLKTAISFVRVHSPKPTSKSIEVLSIKYSTNAVLKGYTPTTYAI